MKSGAKYFAVVFCLLCPALAKAQSTGKVECPRSEGYVYMYSSVDTMDVRATLQCGEIVEITGRYESYFAVRTAKGDTGYVPLKMLTVLKDQPGLKPQAPQAARPRTAYDQPGAVAEPAPKPAAAAGFTLLNGTPIRLKVNKTLSSATAHVGDQVDLEVLEDVLVDGVCVIAKGAAAVGSVTEAEPKKRMGHSGKLGFLVKTVTLTDKEKAGVRSYQEGSEPSGKAVNPLASGKDVVITEGTEVTAYVDGDVHLKREAFQPSKDAAAPGPPTKN